MHTAHVSSLRSALRDYFQEDDADWFSVDVEEALQHEADPHLVEHEARAAELLEANDEDAAIIHQLLGTNMMRAAREAN